MIYTIQVNTKKNNILPGGRQNNRCIQFKISIPYGKQEAGTPFYSIFLIMSYGGSIIMCRCK